MISKEEETALIGFLKDAIKDSEKKDTYPEKYGVLKGYLSTLIDFPKETIQVWVHKLEKEVV